MPLFSNWLCGINLQMVGLGILCFMDLDLSSALWLSLCFKEGCVLDFLDKNFCLCFKLISPQHSAEEFRSDCLWFFHSPHFSYHAADHLVYSCWSATFCSSLCWLCLNFCFWLTSIHLETSENFSPLALLPAFVFHVVSCHTHLCLLCSHTYVYHLALLLHLCSTLPPTASEHDKYIILIFVHHLLGSEHHLCSTLRPDQLYRMYDVLCEGHMYVCFTAQCCCT